MYSFYHSDYLAIRTSPEILQLTFDSESDVDYHRQFERALAAFYGMDNALLFPDGYLAFVALVRNIIQDNDLLLTYSDCNGSIQDVLEIAQRQQSPLYVKPMTPDALRHLPPETRRVVILAYGVSESSCQIAPLDQWLPMFETFSKRRKIPVLVLVDDTFGVGLLGPHYRGTLDHFGLSGNRTTEPNGVQFYFSGSLAEALGTHGGFLVGERRWLRRIRKTEPTCCRNQIPISTIVAATKALELASRPALHDRLTRNIAMAHEKFQAHGISFVGDPRLPILLVKVPQPRDLVQTLSYTGFRVGITHFTKRPWLQIVVNAGHTEMEIGQLAKKLAEEL